MITVNPKYVVDKHQKRKAVLVTADEWEHIVSELEELDDIRAYDAAQPHVANKIPLRLWGQPLRMDITIKAL